MSGGAETYEGELLGVVPELTFDTLSRVQWMMKTGELIYIKDMEDSHLRNTALFLMNFGYTTCIAPEDKRIIWLRVLNMEWQRRMIQKKHGLRKWTVKDENGRQRDFRRDMLND